MILRRKLKASMVRNRTCIIERVTIRSQLADVEVMGHRWSKSCRLHEHWHVLDRLSEPFSGLVTAERPILIGVIFTAGVYCFILGWQGCEGEVLLLLLVKRVLIGRA